MAAFFIFRCISNHPSNTISPLKRSSPMKTWFCMLASFASNQKCIDFKLWFTVAGDGCSWTGWVAVCRFLVGGIPRLHKQHWPDGENWYAKNLFSICNRMKLETSFHDFMNWWVVFNSKCWVLDRERILKTNHNLYAIRYSITHSGWILNFGATGWKGIVTTIALVTCGMLCKEQGITVVGICLIYDLCIVNKVSRVYSFQKSGYPSRWLVMLICYETRHSSKMWHKENKLGADSRVAVYVDKNEPHVSCATL